MRRSPTKIVSVPVGDAMIGRIGRRSLQPPIDSQVYHLPSQTNRSSVSLQALHRDASPSKATDADRHQSHQRHDPHFGRGQRELIIGDRQTDKDWPSRYDTILNQKGGDVDFASTSPSARQALHRRAGGEDARRFRRHGIHHRRFRRKRLRPRAYALPARRSPVAPSANISATTKPPRPLRLLTIFPSTPRRIAKFLCCCGVLPDAKPIRATCSYLHSRLLERAAKLNDALGAAGSLTALSVKNRNPGRRRFHAAYYSDQRHLHHRWSDPISEAEVCVPAPTSGPPSTWAFP